MSTLHIRLPSKAVADGMPNWLAVTCPFALISKGGVIEREGAMPLSGLSGTTAQIQRVVLLLAASDVTLLRVQTPPLSSAKLKAALPSLVEEQLLCDPSDCVIVASSLNNGVRTIAAVQRAWLDLLAKTFISFGARHITALPAQSCLSYAPEQSAQPDMVTAAISQHLVGADLTLRLPEQEGIGLTIMPTPEQAERSEPDEAMAHEIIQALSAVVPTAPIKMYLPQQSIHIYQNLLANMPALQERISFATDNWTHWMDETQDQALDLMTGMAANSLPKLDLIAWRWPLLLSTVILIINICALNIEWWHMKSESESMRSAMIHIYKSAYPKETVIIDPIAQMQQKIAAATRDSGVAAADDFIQITTAFGEAWASITAEFTPPPAIATLEYRDHILLVNLKPAPSQAGVPDLNKAGGFTSSQAGRANDVSLTQRLKVELIKRDLTIAPAANQPGTTAWRIRSSK